MSEPVSCPPYEVVRSLGAGGLAQVWLVRHQETGELLALKVLHDATVGSRAARLVAEGNLLRSVAHENLLQVREVRDTSRGPGLLMAYVEGPTLAQLLGARGPLSLEEVRALADGILAGASAIHARGWVHRDLKPQNVLLAVRSDRLVPVLADFGVTKEVAGDARAGDTTRAGVGTPRYMSLEQVLGYDAEPHMDVFSLGAILFELLEGRPAFPTFDGWTAGIRAGVPPRVTRPDTTPSMRAAIEAALGPLPGRPANAEALRERWGRHTGSSAVLPETLAAARWATAHLPEESADGPLDAAQRAHVEACAQCRAWRRLLAFHAGEASGGAAGSTPAGPPRSPG